LILPYGKHVAHIHPTVFVAPSAVIIGDVEIEEGASVWFGAVLRGDMAPIRIGAGTNIQDNCTLHTDIDTPVSIGAGVTVGHNAVVHGCTIESDCLIGMGALVLNRARVLRGSIIAAGSVVRQDSVIGPGQLAAGTPATIKKDLSDEAAATIADSEVHYRDLAEAYRQSEAIQAKALGD
jgi:carbonic anhydrase/acetyltransferase-like protein (isoleucine patch superfamily)